jgi:hypothetical protein
MTVTVICPVPAGIVVRPLIQVGAHSLVSCKISPTVTVTVSGTTFLFLAAQGSNSCVKTCPVAVVPWTANLIDWKCECCNLQGNGDTFLDFGKYNFNGSAHSWRALGISRGCTWQAEKRRELGCGKVHCGGKQSYCDVEEASPGWQLQRLVSAETYQVRLRLA